jgi:hypothetical protein
MTSVHLNGHHRKTLAGIFVHPAPHNVEWHDVLSLLQNLGTVTDRHNGGIDVTIGDHTVILERPKGHDLEGDQLRGLKTFLTTAGLSPDEDGTPRQAETPAGVEKVSWPAKETWIVLIDHHQSRLFKVGDDRHGAAAPIVLVPDDADGSRRRIEHRQGNADHDGGHASEDVAYYERISNDVAGAERIVVLSDGKGRSSAGEYLVDYLKRNHAGIAKRIVATDRVDISHLSDGQIVAAGLGLLTTSSA